MDQENLETTNENVIDNEFINETIKEIESEIESPQFEAVGEDEINIEELENHPLLKKLTEESDSLDKVEHETFAFDLDEFDPEAQETKIWKARTGLDDNSLSGAIETVIFMSEKPISITKIRKLIDEDIPLKVIHDALTKLQNGYEEAHHGLRLLEVAEGYQFRTKATYSKYVQDLYKVTSLVLSPATLEALSILAYKQPVSKSDIDKIRGVDSSHLVRALMDKKLVKVVGRSEELGRPVLYGTTLEFLEVFNLRDISELPTLNELEDIAGKNEVGSISEIKDICEGEKTRFMFNDTNELEELTSSIKEISVETQFTRSLKVESKKRVSEDGVAVKSAFDLLEEYVESTRISAENTQASISEPFVIGENPVVVKDLNEGPFNVPEVDEDFEMIDLDSGETVNDNHEAETVELDSVEDSDEDLLFENNEEGRVALADALDSAFAQLKGELPDEEKELEESDDQILTSTGAIDDVNNKIIEEAKKHDLNLEFLKEESTEANPAPKVETSSNSSGIDLGEWF